MKYIKMLGLLTVAAAAFMAITGTASATLTAPAGTAYAGNIAATSTNTVFDGNVNITCKQSTIEGDPTSAGATESEVDVLTFTECSRSVTVTVKGKLTYDPAANVYSDGARITVQTTILGFPIHCVYVTNKTKIGRIVEGVNPAWFEIASTPIPQESTSAGCGSEGPVWTGTYTVTTPASAIVVD